MDSSVGWRDQLQLDLPVIRRENVKTVMKTLERYNLNVDEERLLELQKIAQRFEETAYATATSLRHLPICGEEGLNELRAIAQRFEEKNYNAATSQSDYLRKISLKMLTMEAKYAN